MTGSLHQPIRVTPWLAGAPIDIEVERPPSPMPGPESREAIDRWESWRSANPRVFDGTVLCARQAHIDRFVEAARGESRETLVLHARPERFSRWATANLDDEPLVLLSVTAAIVSSEASGEPSVLLGKRGAQVLHYPGLWEVGPSGGITPPARTPINLGFRDLVASALTEVREEVGEPLAHALRDPTLVLLAHDPNCGSLDFVIRFGFDSPSENLEPNWKPASLPHGSWEYSEATFVESRYARDTEFAISPPSAAILNHLLG